LHAKLRNRTCQGLDRQGQGQGQGLDLQVQGQGLGPKGQGLTSLGYSWRYGENSWHGAVMGLVYFTVSRCES